MSTPVFVMTDVVGSTALWETHGDAMRVALETHDRLVHGTIEIAGGRVFKHTGDGMIAVFRDADTAVTAALSVVAELSHSQWGATGPLKVRVSVHAGTAAERNGDFFGPPVNKLARINGVGHPGQVLVSGAAHQLMSERPGLDLGGHRLRDLSEPVQLWQLDHGSHPALRTLNSARHNLPVMSSEFIGREPEVQDLRGLVSRHRLVTITGVGGCGKTRLAVEVAASLSDQFPGGVWFVDLTTEGSGTNVGNRAIGALGLVPQFGSSDLGPVETLNQATATAATLLIMDNCEHLVDHVADFTSQVLATAPSVSVLATSREALAIDGERVWRIPNLDDAAVELFVDRATAAGVVGLDDHLDQISEICDQLDNIPLAIELAAARVASLSIAELAERLDDRFSLLSGGRGRRQRQQTLKTMMDWSYGLLTTDEQALLNQLTVFAGTFPVSGAEAVATLQETSVLDALDSLVEQSLVVASVASGRYRLLETVRLYGLDQLLDAGQLESTRDRHLAWMVGLSGRDRMYSTGPNGSWDLEESKFQEVENALAAMEWAEKGGDQHSLASLFCGGVGYWGNNGSAGVDWIDRIPEPPATDVGLRIDFLQASGLLRYNLGDLATGLEMLSTAAGMVDEVHEKGLDVAVSPVATFFRGITHCMVGDFASAMADSDHLLNFGSRELRFYADFWALQLRSIVEFWRGHPMSFATAAEAVRAATSISRLTHDVAASGLAFQLSLIGRYEEALPGSMQCLDSPVLGQSVRISELTSAAKSLVGLGRLQEALDLIGRDFGPMIDDQRAALRVYQLTALAILLHELEQHDRFQDVASIAWEQQSITDGLTARAHLTAILGEDALSSIPIPHAIELLPERIDTLIDTVVDEIRDHIATGLATVSSEPG